MASGLLAALFILKLDCRPEAWLILADHPIDYPKGIPADAPTSHRDSEWVYAGENGECWFLLRNGIEARERSKLRQEALARQTVDQRNAIRRKSREVDGRDVAQVVLCLVVNFASLGLMPIDPENQW